MTTTNTQSAARDAGRTLRRQTQLSRGNVIHKLEVFSADGGFRASVDGLDCGFLSGDDKEAMNGAKDCVRSGSFDHPKAITVEAGDTVRVKNSGGGMDGRRGKALYPVKYVDGLEVSGSSWMIQCDDLPKFAVDERELTVMEKAEVAK